MGTNGIELNAGFYPLIWWEGLDQEEVIKLYVFLFLQTI